MANAKFLNNLDFVKNQIINAVIHVLASAPSSPAEGQIYHDSTNHRHYYYNGTVWELKATDSDLLQGQNGAYYLGRANHTGTQLAATISDFNTAVRTNSLDQMTAPAADLSINSHKLTNVTDPTAAQDAATKAYVDAIAQGLDVKASVRVATTAALAANTRSGNILTASANGALASIDGVSLSVNDRILVKNEATAANNGIYTITSLGGASSTWSMTRATDADTSAKVTANLYTFVSEGTLNADTSWTLTTNDAITLNTTSLTFTQFSGAGTYTAGTGLTLVGTQFSQDTANGYGIRKYSADVGDGSSTSITVTHSLGTKDVHVTLYDKTTPFAVLYTDVQMTSTSAITLVFAVAPTSNQYRVVVIG